ncbi:hypothetical protein NQ318_014797, partial [Aromia moschata]
QVPVTTRMRFLHLSILIALVLLADGTFSEKIRKHKKYHKTSPKVEESIEISDVESQMMADEAPLAHPQVAGEDMMDSRIPLIDPCLEVHCAAGRVCELDSEGGTPVCLHPKLSC